MRIFLQITTLIIVTISTISSSQAKPKIIASNPALAGIVGMVASGVMEINSINIEHSCPEHYQAKPGDKQRIESSNVAIYIDEEFDGFFVQLLDKFPGKKVKVSAIKQLQFIKNNGKINWHFWLDLENVKNLVIHLNTYLSELYPQYTDRLEANTERAIEQIESLEISKSQLINTLPEIIVISESVEYFFRNMANHKDLFVSNYPGLQYVQKLDLILNTGRKQCIVTDLHRDSVSLEKYKKRLVSLDTENWISKKPDYSDLFFIQYEKILNQIAECN